MKENPVRKPKTTPSILANIPDCLKSVLQESVEKPARGMKSILISSNSLANRFILEKWGIRPSQRKRYRNLFSQVRKQCRAIFQNYLLRGQMEWTRNNQKYSFGVYKFDEIRGNLILGFAKLDPESTWNT